ncbi:hypothetical protein RSAG8_01577, partial [Rhizoctonia solani AG-8 WAC10335]
MSVGFHERFRRASGIRNRMVADPGRADFKDQVQCHGYLFLHEYLDDVLNAPRLDNVIELTKTPGRNKTASKKARALHASAQKIKPVAPIVFPPGPKDKENDSSATSPKQPVFKSAPRSQPIFPEPIAETSGLRDSISRATPARSGVPIFSPANRSAGPLPTPSDDPLSPFRDAKASSQEQPVLIQTNVTAQQIFTTQLVIESSPPPAEKELPLAEEPAKTPEPEQDLSIIQEDDEGQSVAAFEDAREEFTDARSVMTIEADITEVAPEPAPEPPAQRLPSPPASEDSPATASEPPTPVREPEHEPTEPITNTNITIADIFDNAPAPSAPPVSVAAPAPEPTKKSLPMTTSQPTPPPEPTTTVPTVTSPRPLPIPPSRGNSGSGAQQPLKPPSFAQPMHPSIAAQASAQPVANPPRASSAVTRSLFTGPSLKDLRREPSVSGNANRELRQSSWRKKPDGTSAVTATTSISSTTADSEAPRLKRKSDALQLPPRPPPSKSQKMSRGSSPSSASNSEEETDMQIPLKDEDGGSGSWNTGSMLDDLRNRLARLEKSTSGKTPAASRIWTPTMPTTNLPATGSENGIRLSDLSVRPPSQSFNAEKGKEKEKEEPEVIGLDLVLSTEDPTASMLSNRSTTPVDSPPPARRVLPAPPVFALPGAASAPTKAPVNTADAVRAAKADAARLFGGTKFTAPPARTETQTTVATEVSSVFDKATQSQSQFTQFTADTQLESQDVEMDELDADLDLDPDVDIEGDDDMDADMEEDDVKTTSRTSTTQTRSMAMKGPVRGTQLPTATKKTADEQDRKASRLREMEERRQAAALRKADEEKSRLELEKKRREREELAASKGVKAPVKKVTEDPNKKRKLEVETKAAGKKPAVPSSLAQSTVAAATTSSSTKSRIAKPTATPGPGPSALKSAMKSTTTNPFHPAPPAATTKTLKATASSSSLKATAAKKAKGSISDAPGQALQQQMQARVQAQLKATQKEPEIQSESIELPDINSEYSDSDDEDRGKDFPSWTKDQALMDALRNQETFNPDALFGPIQPLKMGDLQTRD